MASITELPPPPAPLTDAYLHRQFRVGVRYARGHDGLLPATRFWDWERARRSLAPARFDRFHPSFGRLLRHEQAALHRPPAPGPPVVVVPVVPVTPVTPPAAVAEPASAVLLALGLAAVFLAGRWRRGTQRFGAGGL